MTPADLPALNVLVSFTVAVVMSGVVRNWRVELIEAYPDLFQPPADFPGAAQGSPECDAGWHDLLDRMCVRIRTAVQADGGPFKFSQISGRPHAEFSRDPARSTVRPDRIRS